MTIVENIANLFGVLAVALFVLSYQLKSRQNLIIMNAASRILYVSQYLLLGAFEGALLDVVALVVTLLCKNRDSKFIKKHFLLTVILSNLFIIGSGMTVYVNIFSLFPILGVIFETLALWPKKEKNIRLLSLLGAPFWLAYNLICLAYGSAIGNVITLVSITVSIIRYDILKRQRKDDTKEIHEEHESSGD